MPHYGRLSGFYFFYFAVLGTLTPYWALYLRAAGYEDWQIGLLMAIPHATKLGAPALWGWLADRTGRRLRIIRLGNFVAATVFMGVYWADGFWSLAMVLLLYSFFWNAVLAQFEVITLRALGARSDRYALIRLWGSVGFVFAVLVVGGLLDRVSSLLIPTVLLSMLWGLWLTTLTLPDTESGPSATGAVAAGKGASMKRVLRHPGLLTFLVCGVLMQASHGPYYTFFTLYLEELGYRRLQVGLFWSLGVVAEVLMFLAMPRWLTRWSLERILLLSLLLAALRWTLTGLLAHEPWVLAAAQCLHGATFASFHAAAIAWVHRTFPGPLAGRGQGLYASAGYGLGWALGAAVSGPLWSSLNQYTFLVAAVLAGLGAILAGWRLRPGGAANAA